MRSPEELMLACILDPMEITQEPNSLAVFGPNLFKEAKGKPFNR